MSTLDEITHLKRLVQQQGKRLERLEKAPFAKVANDAEYVQRMAVEMGLDENVLNKSKIPEVLTARQRLAKRLREEKHWGYARIAAVLQCSETAVQNWRAVFGKL